MVQFTLPANSKIKKGKVVDCSAGAARVRTFRLYRWSAEDDQNPHMDSYTIDLDKCGPMVLDALLYIKNEIDPSLAFRRSCREGVCGSCAMNINGVNQLACSTPLADLSGDVMVYPLPHLAVKRDLVPDTDALYAQYAAVKPWLQNEEKAPERERLQSPEERSKLDGLYECILCFCCSTACPSYWWNGDKFLGPSILMQVYRWLVDSRDKAGDARMDEVEDPFKLYRCHTIMNCTRTCPKNLNPGKAVGALKQLLVNRKDK